MTLTEQQMTAEEYFATPGLSHSAMKDLAVSPLRFWWLHLNPQAPIEEPTPQMELGTALHCAVLEPGQFEHRYACAIDEEDYPGCLRTIEDMRNWLRAEGIQPKGTKKEDVIRQVVAHDPEKPVLDVLLRSYAQDNAGKKILAKEDWRRVERMAQTLLDEPRIQQILKTGAAEVPLFATDPETGVPLKCKLDWANDTTILDLKTFSQRKGKSIDQCVAEAIWYEGYYRQAWFYSYMSALAGTKRKVVMAFVESEQPHEVRLRTLGPSGMAGAHLYWQRAKFEIGNLIRTYADYMKRFPSGPWREAQEADVLTDEEMPGVSY